MRRPANPGLSSKASKFLAGFKQDPDLTLREEVPPLNQLEFLEWLKRYGPPKPHDYYKALASVCNVLGVDKFKWDHSMTVADRASALHVYQRSVIQWEVQQAVQAEADRLQNERERELIAERLGAW